MITWYKQGKENILLEIVFELIFCNLLFLQSTSPRSLRRNTADFPRSKSVQHQYISTRSLPAETSKSDQKTKKKEKRKEIERGSSSEDSDKEERTVSPATVCLSQLSVRFHRAWTVNYEHARDDGLLLIFTSKLGIISLKQHRGHIGNLRRQTYLLQK